MSERLGCFLWRFIPVAMTAVSVPAGAEQCAHCKGSGTVRYYHGDFDTCPTCHGTGAKALAALEGENAR